MILITLHKNKNRFIKFFSSKFAIRHNEFAFRSRFTLDGYLVFRFECVVCGYGIFFESYS